MRFRSAFASQVSAALLPSVVLLLVVPIVRRRLGLEAFAGFTVLISAVSVLTLFDGGLGRSTTYFTSRHIGSDAGSAQNSLCAGMFLGLIFSIVMGLSALVALSLGRDYFQGATPALKELLAFTPMFVLGAIVKGVLEGQRRFAFSTGLQMIYGCAISLAPLALLTGNSQLTRFSLCVGLIRTCLVAGLLATVSALLFGKGRIRWAGVWQQSRVVFNYTKWLGISNMVGLCIVFADRFVIASRFDARIVASYILPMEMVSRVQLLVAAFCSVIFPTLVVHAERNRSDYFKVVRSAQGVVAAGVLTGCCAFVPLAEPVFGWWLGSALGGQAAQIGLISLVGVALIANAALAMVAINSLGHTRQIAGLHAVELVIYVCMLATAVERQSLMLLLLAWLARQLIDAVVMSRILKQISAVGTDVKRAPVRSRSLLWPILLILYVLYVVLAFRLQFVNAANRVAIALGGGTAAVAILATFYFRLREDIAWVRRGAVV